MSGSSTILTFAGDAIGSATLTDAEYLADADRKAGHQVGVARRDLENKVLRQLSVVAAGLAEFVAAEQNQDVSDSVTPSDLASRIKEAVKAVAPQPPASQGDGFASGTVMLFGNATAPTGWTQLKGDQFNNRLMVIKETRGGGYGGYDSPTYNSRIPSHTHTFTTGNQSATHRHNVVLLYARSVRQGDGHYLSDGLVVPSGPVGSHGATTYRSNTEGSYHVHTGTTQGPNGQVGAWNARYLNVIMCRKV